MSAPRPVDQVKTLDVDRCLMLSERMNRAFGRICELPSADAATDVSDHKIWIIGALTQPLGGVVLVQLGSEVGDAL